LEEHHNKEFKKKTSADNLLTPVENKLRFLMKTFQDFSPYNALYGHQMVQAPKDSFSANCKLFKGL